MRTQVTYKYENKVAQQFLPKTKHYLFLTKGLKTVRGFKTIDLKAETLHSCQKIDYTRNIFFSVRFYSIFMFLYIYLFF